MAPLIASGRWGRTRMAGIRARFGTSHVQLPRRTLRRSRRMSSKPVSLREHRDRALDRDVRQRRGSQMACARIIVSAIVPEGSLASIARSWAACVQALDPDLRASVSLLVRIGT
jgi:hypothetical protein